MNPTMQARLNTRAVRLQLGEGKLEAAMRANLEGHERVIKVNPDATAVLRTVDDGLALEMPGGGDYVIGADTGGYCLHTPEGWVHTLPFRWTPRSGPLALIGQHGRQTAWLAEACREARREASLIATVGAGERLADWLDLAGRHEEVTAIGVALTELDDPVAFGRVASAVSAHLPVVVWLPESLSEEDPWLAQWLGDQGILLVHDAAHFVATLTVLADLNPPSGQRIALVSPDRSADAFVGATLRRDGRDVTWISHGSDGVLAATRAAMQDEAFDLVVAVAEADEAPTLAVDLGSLREGSPTPLLVVARGPYGWGRRLAGQLHAFGIPTVLPDAPLGEALRSLWSWGAHEHEEGLEIQVTDQLRARRVLREMITDPSLATSPASHAELLAALAIPMAKTLEVRHLDDALIAAAELGYPVQIAVRHAALDWDHPWQWHLTDDADTLEETAQRLLAQARQRGDFEASVVLRGEVESPLTMTLSLRRHAVYGVTITVEGPATTLHTLPTTARAALPAFVRLNGVVAADRKAVATTLIRALGATNALMRFGGALGGVRIGPLVFHSGGALAGAAMVALQDASSDRQN